MSRPLRVLLVSSSGGVLLDLLALRPWWRRHSTAWVAVRAADTVVALADQRVVWQSEPAGPRAVWGTVRALRPDVIVSAGRGLALRYFLAGRLLGVRTVWLETLPQTTDVRGSARLCARLAHTVLVQRPSRLSAYSGAVLVGELY
ncbi:hypothetical protein [Paractinoplanes rishiriensis]|nr:hypothetical protein [Actinoplanes rishiriensis]